MNAEKTLSNAIPSFLYRWYSFLRSIDRYWIVLLGLPLFLMLVHERWMFYQPLSQHIDCWIYFGHFLDLKQHLNTFAGTYYGTRLPWILPGFLAYRFFSPLVATYIFHLLFYYGATISLFCILKHLMNIQVAFLTTILMGFYCFFLEAIGSFYIDGAGLTYLLLTLLMLTPTVKGRYSITRLCLAGVFYGCMIHTQLFLIVHTPLIFLYYFYISRTYRSLPSLFCLWYFAVGFIGLTLLLCVSSYFLNGYFLFFKPAVRMLLTLTQNTNPWWKPIATWWRSAPWLFLPAIIFIASLSVLAFNRFIPSTPYRRSVLFFSAYFIFHALLYIVIELKNKQPVLLEPYYASYMIPSMFLAIGSIVAIMVSKLDRDRLIRLSILVIAIFCSVYFFLDFREDIPFYLSPLLMGLVGLSFLMIIGTLVTIFLQYNPCKEISIIALCVIMAGINIFVEIKFNRNTYSASLQKQAFLAIVKSVKTIKKVDPVASSFFWYEDQGLLGSIFRSVCSTYLWGYRLINEEFPQVKSLIFSRSPSVGDQIIILTDHANSIEKANQSLSQLGLEGKVTHKKSIHQGPFNYQLIWIKIYEKLAF